eukprot:g75016.t1
MADTLYSWAGKLNRLGDPCNFTQGCGGKMEWYWYETKGKAEHLKCNVCGKTDFCHFGVRAIDSPWTGTYS